MPKFAVAPGQKPKPRRVVGRKQLKKPAAIAILQLGVKGDWSLDRDRDFWERLRREFPKGHKQIERIKAHVEQAIEWKDLGLSQRWMYRTECEKVFKQLEVLFKRRASRAKRGDESHELTVKWLLNAIKRGILGTLEGSRDAIDDDLRATRTTLGPVDIHKILIDPRVKNCVQDCVPIIHDFLTKRQEFKGQPQDGKDDIEFVYDYEAAEKLFEDQAETTSSSAE